MESTSACRMTNDSVHVKIRDYDRDGYEVQFNLAFGQDGPIFRYRDAKSDESHCFRLTSDELKTLTLALECMLDRVEADKGIALAHEF